MTGSEKWLHNQWVITGAGRYMFSFSPFFFFRVVGVGAVVVLTDVVVAFALDPLLVPRETLRRVERGG